MLLVHTLGHFAISYDDRCIEIAGRKSRALLAYLALADTGTETRERIVGLLWSEVEEKRARASLRQTVYEIRETLEKAGFWGLTSDKMSIGLAPNAVQVDLFEIFNRAKAGVAHPLMLERERIIDSLLGDFENVDAAFHVWLLAKRETLRNRLITLLEDVLHAPADQRDTTANIARALLLLDPTHEEAARALIRSRVEAGDIGGALGIYKALWKLLDEEYDVEPSKETQELIAAVKLAQPPPPSAGRTAIAARSGAITTRAVQNRAQQRPRPLKLTVAVGSFDVEGVHQDRRYLVQGFRRELMASLVRFREWGVRDQALVPAGAIPIDPTPSEYIVDGSAFEGPDSVRLLLMMRDAQSNEYLWSERIQISTAQWFDAQQSIVRRLATALNVHLSAERLASVAAKRTNDVRAFDLWLRGHGLLLNFHPKDWEEALTLFRGIIEEAPHFSPVYSSLANAQNILHLAHPGMLRERQREQQALGYARQAAHLDPIDSRAQLCLGWAYLMAKQYELGALHQALARELNENDPWTMVSSALGCAFCGSYDQARDLSERALSLALTPSASHWAFQSQLRFLCEDYTGTVAAAEHTEGIQYVMAWKTAALFHLGRHEAACAEADRFYASISKNWFGLASANKETMTRWLLYGFPISQEGDWERLRAGLAGAGAPTDGLRHHGW